MADNYIEYIANGLKELHPQLSSQGFIDYWDGGQFELTGYNEMINWSWDEFFTSLAWGGLMSHLNLGSTYKITAWENLTSKEKQLIRQYQSYNYESNKCNGSVLINGCYFFVSLRKQQTE